MYKKFKTHTDMTKEELQHRTYIQAAYLSGQLIQLRYRNEFNPKWIDVQNPSFDWECYDYRIKPVAWRAHKGEDYYFISAEGKVMKSTEDLSIVDNNRHSIFNYFKTSDEAGIVAEEFRQLLIKHTDA